MQTNTYAFMPKTLLEHKRKSNLEVMETFENTLREKIRKGLDDLISTPSNEVKVTCAVPVKLYNRPSDTFNIIGRVGLDLELAGYEFSCSSDFPVRSVTFTIKI